MKEAQTQKFGKIAIATDQRGDQAITTILDVFDAARQPAETSLDVGKGMFPTIFDTERDEKTPVMQVFQKIAQSEMGKIYIDGGTQGERLVFENRHHGVDETTIQHDFDDSIAEITLGYPAANIITKARTFITPRETDDSDVVLGQIQKSFSIPAGDHRDITLLYRDPDSGRRISAVTPVTALASGTDYVANDDEDGGGVNRTSDLSVTELTDLTSGNSITYRITNTGDTTLWVTKFQQRGKGIYLFDSVPAEAEAEASYTDLHGEKVLRYDMPYEDDFNVAENFADFLLSVWKDPICQISNLTYYPEKNADLAQAFVDIDIGKRITVNIPHIGIDQDYFVHQITVRIMNGIMRCSYLLAPVSVASAFQLDDPIYGELDGSMSKLAL